GPPTEVEPGRQAMRDGRLRHVAFDTSPTAQLVVDPSGTLTLANYRARALLGINAKDVGRPLRDLDIYRQPFDLAPLIERVIDEGRPAPVQEAEWQKGEGEPRYLTVRASPLIEDGDPLAISLVFNDVTEATRLRRQAERTNAELERANEEI